MSKTVYGFVTLPFAAFIDDEHADGLTGARLAELFDVHETRFFDYALSDDSENVVIWDSRSSISIDRVEDGDEINLGTYSVTVGGSELL
jgi:hypothetical protein